MQHVSRVRNNLEPSVGNVRETAAHQAEAVRIATEFMELHRKYWPDFEGESEVRPIDQGP